MTTWTEAQLKAIHMKGRRILISAGAGSGKTRVLIDRIAYLVQNDQVQAKQILALTFTDKAAVQMKKRLEQTLGINEAMVCTFHAFCGKIIRDHPVLADVDPAFVLIDEAFGRAQIRRQMEKVLYEQSSLELQEWVDFVGSGSAIELLLSAYEWWRERPVEMEDFSAFTETIYAQVRSEEENRFQDAIKQVRDLYISGRIKAPGTIKRMEMIVESENRRPMNWPEISSHISRNVSVEAKPLFEKLLFWKQNDLWRDLLNDHTRQIRTEIFSVLLKIDEMYTELKREHGWVDFADLQRMAYRVLSGNSSIREWYSENYLHILVDEYQDTNPLQQSILEMLGSDEADQTSIFMVGDARQSIYRFRGADVSGFERMRKEAVSIGTYVELRDNFRAHPSLAAYINEWSQGLFGAALNQGVTAEESVETVVELLVPEVSEREDYRQAEADLIARRICEIPSSRWGDIAILLQTRTHLSHYQKVLEAYKLPYQIHAEASYWKRQEVLDLFHLLRVVNDPGDAIALLGYLKGPLVGLSDDSLWRLAKQHNLVEGFLGDMLLNEEEIDAASLHDARRFIERLRRSYQEMSLTDWLYSILYEEGVMQIIGLQEPEILLQMAEDTERQGEIYLSDLLQRWIESAQDGGKGGSTADQQSSIRIRVMTIHAAKGLEFPIVFVPDLSRRFSQRTEPIQMNDKWGLTLKFYLDDAKSAIPSLAYEKARLDERSERIAEQKRLLYVAMTRAKELLILSASAPNFTDKDSLDACSNWFDWLPFLHSPLKEGLFDGNLLVGKGWAMHVRRSIAKHPNVCQQPEFPVESLTSLSAARSLNREKHKVVTSPVPTIWSVTDCVKRLEVQKSPVRYIKSRTFIETMKLEEHGLGHILHHVLEHISPADDLETIHTQRMGAALAAVGITSIDGREMAWERLKNSIAAYLQDELHHESCEAIVSYRELPFTLRLFEQPEGSLYINGVIDKLWQRKDGKATLIDVKTHRIKTRKQQEHIVHTYTPQVQLYAYAVEKLLGLKIERAGLYLTDKQQFVAVPCDASQLDSLLKRLNGLWLAGNGK